MPKKTYVMAEADRPDSFHVVPSETNCTTMILEFVPVTTPVERNPVEKVMVRAPEASFAIWMFNCEPAGGTNAVVRVELPTAEVVEIRTKRDFWRKGDSSMVAA